MSGSRGRSNRPYDPQMGGSGQQMGGYSWILQPFRSAFNSPRAVPPEPLLSLHATILPFSPRVYAHHYYSGANNLIAMVMSPAIVAMPYACYQGGYISFVLLLFLTALGAQQSLYFLAVSTEVRVERTILSVFYIASRCDCLVWDAGTDVCLSQAGKTGGGH